MMLWIWIVLFVLASFDKTGSFDKPSKGTVRVGKNNKKIGKNKKRIVKTVRVSKHKKKRSLSDIWEIVSEIK